MFKRNLKRVATVTIAALVIGLCFTEAALARGGNSGGNGGGRGGWSGSRGGNTRAARSYRGGNVRSAGFYGGGRHSYGRGHRWGYSRYYTSYGCNLYYDYDDQCWYYWCQPAGCYYPVDYCPYGTYSW